MKYLVIAVTLLLIPSALGGCAKTVAPQPEIRTVEVKVPVPQPCVPASYGPAPDYPDTDSALRKAADAAERYLLLAAGRKLRVSREKENDTVIAGCPKVGK